MSANKLEGKIALVTGGNSGIGFSTAKLFVEHGAIVYITGRRQAELDKAVATIGRNVFAIQSDVSILSDIDKVYSVIREKHGKLDIIFANAGVAKQGNVKDVTEEFYDTIFNINVKGLYFTVQKGLSLLPDGATIVLNGSIVGIKGYENNSVYSATKAAVRSFARTWTSDLKARKIRVNVVSPGPIQTPIFDTFGVENPQQILDLFATHVPLGRVGQPEEIAKAVLFLASDDSSYVAGSELFVDGGLVQV